MSNSSAALDYIKARYDEEQARYDQVEAKCTHVITLTSIGGAALGGIVSLSKQTLFNPRCNLQAFVPQECFGDTLVLIGISVTGLALGSAFCACIMALQFVDAPVAARNNITLSYIRHQPVKQATEKIFNCYQNTLPLIEAFLSTKITRLRIAYGALLIALFGVFVSTVGVATAATA